MLINSPIIYKGNEYIDNPDYVLVDIDDTDKKRIKDLQAYIKANPFIFCIRMDVTVVKYTDTDDEEVEFQSEVDNLIVYKESVYYFGQDKHDSSAQIESADMQMIIFKW